MDRARPFPDAARSLVTLSNPQTPFAELATHRRKALRHFFTWFAGVIARAEGGSGQSLTLTSLPARRTTRWPARPRKDPRGGHRIRHPDICHGPVAL